MFCFLKKRRFYGSDLKLSAGIPVKLRTLLKFLSVVADLSALLRGEAPFWGWENSSSLSKGAFLG